MTTEPKTDFVMVPREALDWLFGLGDSFEPEPGQRGAFWWRSEFRRRIAAAPSLENRGVEPYTDASVRDCPAADGEPLPAEIEFAQVVLRPLAFRVQGRASAGANVAIGQHLRAGIERALTMAADLIEARAAPSLGGWRPVAEAPETGWGQTIECLLYGSTIGVRSGHMGRLADFRWANIASLGGNAIDDWGVTHFHDLPAPPVPTEDGV